MGADALVTQGARTSEVMALTKQDEQASIFHMERFQASEYQEFIENGIVFLGFLK